MTLVVRTHKKDGSISSVCIIDTTDTETKMSNLFRMRE